MPPSERDTSDEAIHSGGSSDHTTRKPPQSAREQHFDADSNSDSAEHQGGTASGHVPPSQRYGSSGSAGSRLGRGDIEGPIHVKLILLMALAASKCWHLVMDGVYWVLPRITGTTDPREGISGYFYPDEMISDDEFIVHEGNPSRWVMLGPYIVAIFLLVLATVVLVGVPLGYGEAMLDSITPDAFDLAVPERWWYFPLFLIGVVGVLLFRQAVERGSTWHIVTNRQVLHRSNVINVTKQRFDLHEIQNVEDHYPPPERFYNVGHIDFFTAGTGSSEVHFHGVDDPSSLIKEIKHYMRIDKEQRLRGGLVSEAPDGGQSPAQPSGPRSREMPPRSESDRVNQQRPVDHGGESDRQEQNPQQRPLADERETGDNDSDDYPWRQPPEQGGDSIEDQMSKQSLRDEMRDINDR